MLRRLLRRLLAWFSREEAQDLIEYALVTGLISVAIVTGVIVAGLTGAFETWVTNIAAAINT